MMRQYIAYILVALLAMQSIVALADAHQYHQTGSEHIVFDKHYEISGSEPNLIQTNIVDYTQENTMDCQHCCHCHGSTGIFISDSQTSFLYSSLTQIAPEYHSNYRSETASPETPPPISQL
ncbi:MAG: hypothetical protein MI976_05615 [Pseudomonadales bacterium]|nr:hypothetical protein [Pseudomonadales bacterium]